MEHEIGKEKKHLAIVLPSLQGGGAERVSLSLAEEFIERGFQASFVLMRKDGELLRSVPGGVRIVDLSVQRLREVPSAFSKYLQRERPDAVIANIWPLTSMCVLGRLLARSTTRLVLADHSTLSFAYEDKGSLHFAAMKSSIALTYRLADARVCVSSGAADDLAALSGIPRRRFEVVYNAISTPSELGEEKAADAHWGPRSLRIISVGSFRAAKNHALLIRAFARLSRDFDARLMLLGKGNLRGELEALARSEGVADRVLMPGFFPDPGPFYKSADLFVLSSNYEGLPTVLVEALSHGLPVVSTDCPSGPAEILENGRYGRLVPVGDEEHLAHAMAEALTAKHDREALKRRAADFSPKAAADKYLRLLFPREYSASEALPPLARSSLPDR
jgi:glycosyltransferase involved in cell wall biosynthesis